MSFGNIFNFYTCSERKWQRADMGQLCHATLTEAGQASLNSEEDFIISHNRTTSYLLYVGENKQLLCNLDYNRETLDLNPTA